MNAERKSLYNDIENLRQYGLDIVGEQHDRTYYYYLVSRQFELAELKLLVDSVQSAKFITEGRLTNLLRRLRVWQANIRHHSFSIRFMYLSA